MPQPHTPPVLLGSAHDDTTTETAQELCVVLRNIMLAALRYDTGQHGTAENSLILALQVKLLALDETIMARLWGTPAYKTYLAADRDMQHKLLLSNAFLKKDGYLDLRQALARLNATVAGHDELRDALAQKNAVWVKLKALVLPGPHEDTADDQLVASPELRPWVRYYAWRKVQLLNQLEQAWLLHDFVADDARLINQLNEGSDLALLHLAQFAPRPLLQSRRAVAPAAEADVPAPAAMPVVLLGAAAPTDDVAATKQELSSITDQLKQAAAALNGTSLKDEASLTKYERQYADLSQKQAAYTYLLAQKKNALSTAAWAKQSAADWLSANRANKSAVVLATGKALWAGAGLTLATALKNHLTGKPVAADWGQKALTGVAIAAGTAVATYLLGPLGPMVSNMALGYFYPQPDPVMDKLKSIESTVELGFQRTEQRLDKLADKLTSGFAAVSDKLERMGELVLEKTKLQQELQQFTEGIERADQLLTALAQPYNRLFSMGVKERTALTDDLLRKHNEFGSTLEALVQRLYHREYQLELAQLKEPDANGKEAPAPTIAQIIMHFYQRPDPRYFQPFHVACRDISALAGRLRLLVLRYFSIRPQLQAVLAAAAVFMEDDNKRLVVARLKDMQRREADERAAYFAGVMLLDRLVLGESNHTVYQHLQSYLQTPAANSEFNLLKGFGLLSATDAGLHYEPDQATDGAFASWLRPARREGAPARYYVAPVSREQTGNDLTYQLFSFWRQPTVPARLRLHLALAPNDQVRLYPADFNGAPLLARAVPLTDAAFDGSFEQWALMAEPMAADKLSAFWSRKSLPQARFDVGLAQWSSGSYGSSNQLKVKLLGPGSESTLPEEGRDDFALDRLWLLPVLRPDAVGVRVQEKMRDISHGWHDLTAIGGLWTTQRALGNYRPVISDESPQAYQRTFPEELSRRLPFRHVLYPGDVLQSLRSPNGRYWLQLDCETGREPVLYLYDNDQQKGSVFNHYDYPANIGRLRLVLQTDGNLVLYDDDADHAVAATHTHGQTNSCLCLTDQGQLQLLAPNGTVRRTLALHSVKMKRGGRTSYWRTGQRIKQDQELHSPNGAYRVQLHFCRDADSREYNGQHPNEMAGSPVTYDSVWRVGFRLVRYHQQREQNDERYLISLVPPVSHSDHHVAGRYHWDKCSDELVNYIDEEVSESKQMKVFLHFRTGGEVVGSIVSRQLILFKNYYGIKLVRQLLAPSAESAPGVFLALADDGSLCLRASDTDQVLQTLLRAL